MATYFRSSFIILCLFLYLKPAYSQDPIVYSRCERTTQSYELTDDVTIDGEVKSASRTMTGLDIYDVLPDVTNFWSDFSAPCDLVYRDSDGSERILYDCSTVSTTSNACAALDAAVSFDGKTIAFSVFRGALENYSLKVRHDIIDSSADPTYTGKLYLPNKKLVTTGAHLHTVDVATGALSFKAFESGIFDSGPAFLANGRLAFTSNRDKHTSTVVWRATPSREGSRIWSIDLNWKNLDLSSHHSLSQEQGPYLLKNGRLAYSSWQILGSQPFRHTNGSVGGFTTLDNLFHLYTQFPDGAENFALYGQHSGDHYPSYFGTNHNATHFITQTGDERIWVADYYRGNNNGLGILTGFMAEPDGQEGISPTEATIHSDIFAPRDAMDFAPWATNADQISNTLTSPSIKHPSYDDNLIFAGKVGHPAALTDNGLMLAWGKGACSLLASSKIFSDLGLPVPSLVSGSGTGVAMNMMTNLNMDTPACDVGVYRATAIPSSHPSDLELIVDSPDWHEIMARAVVPYSSIHGVEKPLDIPDSADKVDHPLLEKGTPFGLLGAASIVDRETHPREGIEFSGEYQFNLQGTDTINYEDEDLCGVRILSLLPNRSTNTYYGLSNLFGERVRILGEFSVLNKTAAGETVLDENGNQDTSFLVRFPANNPYLMQAIDCSGRTLNTDMTWQSLRPGEQKTCGGCHVHSRESETSFEDSYAATDDYQIPELGEGVISLLNGKDGADVNIKEVDGNSLSIDFERDIMPIFSARCNSCHGGDSPDAGLALDITGDNKKKDNPTATWWCLVGDYIQSCLAEEDRISTGVDGTKLRRPQVTKYVRAFNSLGSLLYWKAANERTDRNEDSTYGDDIDFGADHPTDITKDELGLLSRWIDIGVPGGDDELMDTQKPTLTVVAAGGSASILKIGTADTDSGINTNSLIVCILDGDSCGSYVGEGVKALTAGVTEVNLSDTSGVLPTTEILISVEDLSGNKTEIRRTVGYLEDSKSSNLTISPIDDHAIFEKETVNFVVDVSDGNDTENSITVLSSAGNVALVDGYEYKLTPPYNYDGDISVMVIVEDILNASDRETTSFEVSVTQINDAPTAIDITDIETSMNQSTGDIEVNVSDPDLEDTHELTIKVEPEFGVVVINGMFIEYIPNSDFFGEDTFELTAMDSEGLSIDVVVNVIVNKNNTAPQSATALIETTANTPSDFVSVNIIDADTEDHHTITLKSSPTFGIVEIQGAFLKYSPNQNFVGSDSFEITVFDSGQLSVDGNVNVTVVSRGVLDDGKSGSLIEEDGTTDNNNSEDNSNIIEDNNNGTGGATGSSESNNAESNLAPKEEEDSGGGSINYMLLYILCYLFAYRRYKNK